MPNTNNLNVTSTMPLATPRQLKQELPMTDAAAETVIVGRREIRGILDGSDPRLAVIVGPCSIHDPDAALEYARRLVAMREKYAETLAIIMRVYFEKPRTTVGWKGLIYDPHLDGSDAIGEGLRIARKLLLQINDMGLPCASEFLDPVIPQYTAELISWAAIGARTTESQTHREMCSGLSMPVGFKNSTEGNLQIAIDAMVSSQHPHTFLGVDQDGVTSLVRTKGNPWSHIVLRGGRERPNYDEISIGDTLAALRAAGQREQVMIDCSHANSRKDHNRQCQVLESVVSQRERGTGGIMGVMLESNLNAGKQKMAATLAELQYGVSITDACIDWATTEELLESCASRPVAV